MIVVRIQHAQVGMMVNKNLVIKYGTSSIINK